MSQVSQPPVILKYLWNMLFAIFYPALVIFSLVFTGILLIFSNFSRLVFAVIRLFGKKSGQAKIAGKHKTAHHPHH